MIQNNTKYMTDQEYDDLVIKCKKAAYEFTLEELEQEIDTGYDCINDYRMYGEYKMLHHCNVVMSIFEEINEERLKVKQRNDKISGILNETENTVNS